MACAAGASLIAVLLVLVRWVRHYVSEDQALLWAAARAWGQGRPQQPSFWGQSYGTTLEAIPTEFLRVLGVPMSWGLPISVAILNLAGLAFLAGCCYRVKAHVCSVALLALPALLSPQFLILNTAFNTAAGRGLAYIACGLFVLGSRETRHLVAFASVAVGSAALALQFDTSTLLILAPGALCFLRPQRVFKQMVGRKMWVASGAALLPALGYGLLRHFWFVGHPADILHPAPAFTPKWSVLATNFAENRDELLAPFHFLLLSRFADVVLLALLCTIAMKSIQGRLWMRLIAMLALATIVVSLLSLPKSVDWMPTSYYPASRTLVALPAAVVLLFVGLPTRRSLDDASATRVRRRLNAPACVAATSLISVAYLLLAWTSTAVPLRDSSVLFANYPLYNALEVEQVCVAVSNAADSAGIGTVVFDLRSLAYACAGLDTEVSTLYPPYERRAWLLEKFLRPSSDHAPFLIVDSRSSGCPGSDLVDATCSHLKTISTESFRVAIYEVDPFPEAAIRGVLVALGFEIRPPF